MICPTYVAELAPKEIRGRITGYVYVVSLIPEAHIIVFSRSLSLLVRPIQTGLLA